MIIKINEIEKDSLNKEIIYGKTYFEFNTKYCKCQWFVESGYWFLYILLWKYYLRFGDSGFFMGKIRIRR